MFSRLQVFTALFVLSLSSTVPLSLGTSTELATSLSNGAPSTLTESRSKTEHAVASLHAENPVTKEFTKNGDIESFASVCAIAAFNVIFNTFRPDGSIPMQMRLPRIMWELVLFSIASRASKTTASPATYILLAITTATTALIDIFIWAPFFGAIAKFETCSGGWWTGRPHQCQTDYIKGMGRVMISAQSLLTGLVYLVAAIHAWGAFTAIRDEQKLEKGMHGSDS